MKTFIFDLDGTLVNTIYDITDGVNYALGRRGGDYTDAATSALYVGHGLDDFLVCMAPEFTDTPEKLADFRADYQQWYARHYMSKSRPYPGICELIAALKNRGCRVVMASNKTDEFVREFNRNVFGGAFELAVGQKQGVPPKPSAELGIYLMEKLGEKPENCIMVGDSKYDILFAGNCGFYSVAVDWGFAEPGELEDAGADLIVCRAADILPLCNE